MEQGRGIDKIWTIQLMLAMRRLITMAMWQSYLAADDIDAMVKAIDRASFEVRPKSPQSFPIVKKHCRRLMTHGAGVLGIPTIKLVKPYLRQIHWQRNANYRDEAFAIDYASTEFVGPYGHAYSNNLRLGMMIMGPNIHYPPHAHPAAEAYYVLGGTVRFRRTGHPWRNCPAGQFAFHQENEVHEMVTRDAPGLLLYLWRCDVETQAQLTDYPEPQKGDL